MSYAIIINRGCRKDKLNKAYMHNKRLKDNYNNKNIDLNKSKFNYSLKDTKEDFKEEAEKIIKENNLKFNINNKSYIAGEYIITSDNEYFKRVGKEETERYFKEAYNFVSNYKSLGEKYIISADVHMDEETPHMHLIYMPVVHMKDKDNNFIDKLCFSDFWKGKESYKNLQDEYYNYIKEKGFDLERGKGGRKHIPIETLKEITGFYRMKELERENKKLKKEKLNSKKIYKDIINILIKESNISKEQLKEIIKEKYKLKQFKKIEENNLNKSTIEDKFNYEKQKTI